MYQINVGRKMGQMDWHQLYNIYSCNLGACPNTGQKIPCSRGLAYAHSSSDSNGPHVGLLALTLQSSLYFSLFFMSFILVCLL